MADLCEKVGGNVQMVAKRARYRIGSKFLHPGPGSEVVAFPKILELCMHPLKKIN